MDLDQLAAIQDESVRATAEGFAALDKGDFVTLDELIRLVVRMQRGIYEKLASF